MPRKITVAGVQMAPDEDKGLNIDKAAKLARLAAVEKGAKIICLPQLFANRWFPATVDKKYFSLAEASDGETITAMRALAKELKTVLIAPIFERDGDKHYNTAFVIGQDGSVLGKYRKVHVPQIPLWEERAYFSPGDLGFPVIETPFARIGVLLCWDVFFPEAFRSLALSGAEVVFVPSASAFYHSRQKWERAVAAAAHANGFFVFRANRVGSEESQEFYGRSFCAGPDGESVVSPAGSFEGVVLAECDLGVIGAVRNEWVFLKDRRPETYKKLTEKTG